MDNITPKLKMIIAIADVVDRLVCNPTFAWMEIQSSVVILIQSNPNVVNYLEIETVLKLKELGYEYLLVRQ